MGIKLSSHFKQSQSDSRHMGVNQRIEEFAIVPSARHAFLSRTSIVRLTIVCVLVMSISGCFVVEFLLTKQIAHVSVSPTGNEVAFVQFPNRVRVKSLVNGDEDICTIRVPLMTEEVHFTSDGTMVAVDQPEFSVTPSEGSVKRTLALYKVNTCELARKIPLQGLEDTTALAFARDGSFFLRSSEQSGTSNVQLDLMDSETGDSIASWSYPDTHPISFALSGDNTLVLVGMAQHRPPTEERQIQEEHIGKAVLIQVPTGEIVNEWVEHEDLGIRAVAISADASTIAFKYYDGTLKTTHLPTGNSQTISSPMQEVEALLTTIDSISESDKLLVTPDGNFLFSYSFLDFETMYAYRMSSGEQVHEFVYEDDIGDFDIDPFGQMLVVGTDGGEINVTDLGPILNDN